MRDRSFWLRELVAAGAGVLLYLAFPPIGLWLLAPVGLGLLYACLTLGRPGPKLGALTGFVFGLGFFLPLLPWIGVYVGALPWIALAVVCAGYLALFGAIATVTMRRRGPRWTFGSAGTGSELSVAAPLWFALCWTAVEWLRSSFPFGGFPWGAAAFSQTEGFFLPFARWFGVPGLSFILALTGAGVAAVVIALAGRRIAPAAVACALVPLALAGTALGTAPSPTGGKTLEVAAIQGNVPRLGLEFNEQRRAVLDNHFRETLKLAEDVDAGRRPRPQVVLWPENASDISPLDNPDAAREIRAAVSATGVPIVFGTLLVGDDDRPTNSVLVWGVEPGGLGAPAPSARYDKHIVQPFGEYLPWRSFFSMFSSYADMAGNFRAGTGRSVLPVQTNDGRVLLGVSTCWEVAFDRSPRRAVREGAQLLFVPTNNATFGKTHMTYQQLAMSQVRAVETDRAVAVAATSGVSALIAPDGRVLTNSEIFTPAILQAALPLRTGETLAVRLGVWPQVIALLATLAGFLSALARPTRFYTLPDRKTRGQA
ncbi:MULTISPECIES: apolipoprotein N-acyltransferase [unclassified Gordonia (in: high G+C Gram-positive bacteria)]|uniref:apolipoprotein N-acyltransferase n=1 Tax=unclassified Gordonia (in: high G+C Gram-positive bacteria) TaxID=2657482 RepID=UPI001FFEE5D7|nr:MULTISPECIES: apolipoprotein N-acyltransferase [unclassified Gordonia (in: high G+C Gram-positive bacteria)]UQE76770.1 apolipoprotein N-acyltransferase [Gordonia sp. PP30]